MTHNDDFPLFSRSGGTNPGGKLIARIDIPCTEELFDSISAMAMLAGIPRAEYARKVLERAMFGEVAAARNAL